MKHRTVRILDSTRNVAAAATKRMTLWFAEGAVESLVQINQMQQDAADENNQELLSDIDSLLKDLGLREESRPDQ